MAPLFKLCLPALFLAMAVPAQAEEKVLNLYSWADYVAPETLQRFEKETGIHVRYDTFDTPEVLETKLLTGGSGYDVVVPSSSVLARGLAAGALKEIPHDGLKGYANLDPDMLEKLAAVDPGNRYGVPYTWGTLGLGMNVEAVKQRLPNVPLNSLDLLFKPEYASKLKDCGIAILDSPQEVIGLALHYLGKDPYSTDKADLTAADALLRQLQPSVLYVATGRQINDLANGSVCLALTYNGDASMAADQARKANKPFEVAYRIPREGTLVWQDNLAIPKDAPHPEAARAFIEFMLRPESVAALTNTLFFATANQAATPLVDEAVRSDPDIYPQAEVRERLYADRSMSLKDMRQRTRLWTTFRSRQ
ncbi:MULTISPECIES: polyamine ABC transporter substrate-binding protein [Pseudomonas]|jgi:putrescine transport system substrate-binding protein|uniref:Putrescine transport system substrate-binding protein n=1 Tax=Pseudomonas umsongensis TaxID=198618 RepID=A0ACC5MB75_9PSED|nr:MULTISPECIES: polyamine ABC transporter substrate-binding protein [Pseudomonas]MBB2885918.1 putrescine transport system substrate-binding protein [Pseudomonas umsongensis]NMN75690.1 putrescine transport system substrate-binding protein [Pseudomonas sp. KD5]GID03495.1 putrescine-binding periplasmic protein [Pseudomonas sp. 008]CAH0158569.1 Putrescine-binding periplasmic protein SpuD [Pseudomonas sp. Bi123]